MNLSLFVSFQVNSFDGDMNGNPMNGNCTPPHLTYLGSCGPDDRYSQPPNSVSSDLPGTPSELSSPMSQ